MQTFLPYADFRRSAATLDPARLGKQRVETLQILRALHFDGYGWANHPAVLMWRGCTPALVAYGLAVVQAWTAPGRPDTTGPMIAEFDVAGPQSQAELVRQGALPPWLGNRRLHRSHRSALVRKDPAHYRAFFPDVPEDLPYHWPAPGPAPEPAPVSAWLVRGRRRRHTVELELDTLGGVRRSALMVARFLEQLDEPSVVAVPEGDLLHVAVVTGDGQRRTTLLRRPVRWLGTVGVDDLRFRAALQNPQPVSALHAEPALEALAAAPSAGLEH